MSRNETGNKQKTLLIEFKAHRELARAFDNKAKSRFSNLSEARVSDENGSGQFP
jgi:hypothetical protein